MRDYSKLEEFTAKELRKVKMNLNNRLESFKKSDDPKELSKSHMLHGMSQNDCEKLLTRITKLEKERKTEK